MDGGGICKVGFVRLNLSGDNDSVQNASFLVGAIQIVWLACVVGHRPFKIYAF